MTSRLSLYNDALLLCGERAVASLSESVETRRLLDQVWDGGGVNYCLELGQWFFAMRGTRIDYDAAVTPEFGYARAFSKPSDWVNTSAVCSDEFFRVPLTRYVDEAGYWYADDDLIYVRYVSSDSNYGANLALWPGSFAEYVAAEFAYRIIAKISNDRDRIKYVRDERERLLKVAKNRCAMAAPTSFPAQGAWTRARMRGSSRRDGGNTSGDLY